MKIVFQHSGILPVLKYGGIERILFWHMVELAKRGHKVVLFGHRDSQVEDYGIELHNDGSDWVDRIPADTDIIHLTYNFTPDIDIPTLVNIQGNGQPNEVFPLNTVFVSRKHAQNHGSDSFIYNAIDLSEYPFEVKKNKSFDNLMFLAKGSWSVKNLKDCVSIAKKTKKHLHIAGGKVILPSRYITSYGMVGGNEKIEVFKKCDALLFPIRWHEPFGIAVIEAMAMGLPVFGSPYGSLPELIGEDKEVGRIFQSKTELIDYLELGEYTYDSEKIRKFTEKNFSIERLTDSYLMAYGRIISGEKLNTKGPKWCFKKTAQELLDF